MRVLGLDVGERRIGVAICDYSGLLATPYTAIFRQNLKKDVETIVKIAAEEEAERIVVGMPFSLDGSEGHQAKKTRRFYEEVKDAVAPMPVDVWDERFSSEEAERRLHEAGVAPSRNRGRLDAAAAAIILQSYLDSRRSQP